MRIYKFAYFSTCKRREKIVILQNGELSILTRLGLTISQAKVYLALVRSGVSTAKTISDVTKIARHDIYRVTHTLEELGFVEKTISVPTKFKAIPLQEGFSLLQKGRNKLTSELNVKIKEILQNFKENSTREAEQNNDPFVLIPKNARIVKKIKSYIETAQTSVNVVSSWNRALTEFVRFDDLYKKALKRGVTFRYVIENPKSKRSLEYERKTVTAFKEYPFFEVRHISTPVTSIVALKDKKEVLIFTSASLGLNEASALWSNNPCLVKLAENYFDCMWARSLEAITKHNSFLAHLSSNPTTHPPASTFYPSNPCSLESRCK
jgi:sugar-specific transcriptional regulator TrmB